MATSRVRSAVGEELRAWRERRRLTQLELALDAGISARHLSFVETGRSKPGREMLLQVLERLQVPFRERNQLLLAAGHAPAFPERPLEGPELEPVRGALDLVLRGHEPYPGVVVDRGWNLVSANAAMLRITELVEIDPALLEPPMNVIRAGLHPRGLARVLVNLGQWRAHFLERLERQFAVTADERLAALIDEVAGYPADPDDPGQAAAPTGDVLGPLRLRLPDGELSFLGMFATFDMPFEVTTSELAMELMFPADRKTREILEELSDAND